MTWLFAAIVAGIAVLIAMVAVAGAGNGGRHRPV
jgi:hypothetical protein